MKRLIQLAEGIKYILPGPFTIAIGLTVLTLGMVLILPLESSFTFKESMTIWSNGLWSTGLLAFMVQMMLMLVLGHVIALAPGMDRLINRLIADFRTTASAAAVIAFCTILVAFFNWGLGLIFGAVFARKAGEHFSKNEIPFNYPLLGAAGYIGLMVWHGGLSGSSLTKVNEPGHLRSLAGNLSPDLLVAIPDSMNYGATVFSPMNLVVSLALLVLIPLFFYRLGKNLPQETVKISSEVKTVQLPVASGAEKIDRSRSFGSILGFGIISWSVFTMIAETGFLGFFNPNNINLLLLGMALLLHGTVQGFLTGVDHAIGDASGILIQFPLYFGIIALFSETGLLELVSGAITSMSNADTFPIFTFLSAGVVNVFVPSGGGQWVIQGPVLIRSALDLNVPLAKCVMALAYGDQLTNMLQPFWALPLLGITGLKAKAILPYTLGAMLVGALVFILGLLVF